MGKGADTNVLSLPPHRCSDHPVLRAARVNDEHQAAAIVIFPRLQFSFDLLNVEAV